MADASLMARRLGPASVFLPDQAFWRIKSLLIERTGHFFYADKDTLLWERLRQRLQQTGSRDCAEYLRRLADRETGDAEWTALEAQITIGETFFFRYQEQFAALQETILPAIIAQNQESRRIRIWSAGCATGAEPYSVAILLRRLLGEAIGTWRISITGTDLNERFLAAAREARYGTWALRALRKEEIERDFTPAPDGRSWVLRPLHRSMVRFHRQNLLSLLFDRAPLELTEFDLILCRNVLIYFHPEIVEPLVRALAARLVPDGWLLLGHAESNTTFDQFLAPINLPGAIAYRPRTAADRPPSSLSWSLTPSPAWPPTIPESMAAPSSLPWPVAPPPGSTPAIPGPVATPPSLPWPVAPSPGSIPTIPEPVATPSSLPEPTRRVGTTPMPALSPDKAPVPTEPPDADDALGQVRGRANLGDLAGAEQLCQGALAATPTSPELHFYQGLLAEARGAHDAAEAGFRRAIYLYNDFAMAHYHLGLLLIDRGRKAAGRRFIANAARICAALPEAAPLTEGDDMTAGALRDVARACLGGLPSEPD